MELKFLGRGSAFNVKEGNTSAYIKQNDMLLLIDCGESVFQRILEKNLLDDVKEVNVLITHFHSDHCGSLSSLIMYCYYCKGIKPNVYYPEREKITNFLEYIGTYEIALWNYLDLKEFSKRTRIVIDYFKSSHVKEIKSYGYEIDDEPLENGKYIIYSGDTNEDNSEELMCSIQFADEIYHDCCLADYEDNVHTSLRKLCELVPKEYRHKVYCMHIDNLELVEKARVEGFNVVEVE